MTEFEKKIETEHMGRKKKKREAKQKRLLLIENKLKVDEEKWQGMG